MGHLLQKLHRRYPFPGLVWYLLVETIMARGAFFLAMPFVAFQMSYQGTKSAALIGAVLGVGPLVGTLAGFYIGHLSDLIGRRKIMLFSLLLWALVFYGFSLAHSPLVFAILMGLNGLARASFEPVTSALISDLCHDQDPGGELQKKAFHLRYFAINIGAAIGPTFGALLMLSRPGLGFKITACAYGLAALGFWLFSRKFGLKAIEKARVKSSIRFYKVLKVLANDKVLQIYLLAFFLLSMAFSQLESNLALHLKQVFSKQGILLFAQLTTLNGTMVVLCTLPLLRWTKHLNLNHCCAASVALWGIGYFILAFASMPWQFFLAMSFMTLGEIVVFANGGLMIESLAPNHMKGAYLASTNLGHTGMVIGPALGGLLMEQGSSMLLFLLAGLLMFVIGYLYLAAQQYQHYKRQKVTTGL